MPFAVVPDDALPCCVLLGTNFISVNRIVLDYRANCLVFGVEPDTRKCFLPVRDPDVNLAFVLNAAIPTNANSSDEELGGFEDAENSPGVKFMLNTRDIMNIQLSDFALNKLRTLVNSAVPVVRWTRPCLKRYKRYAACMKLVNNVLVRVHDGVNVPIIPFNVLVDVVVKVHQQLAHIGIAKTLYIVSQNFWHPAIREIAKDVCSTCSFCQLYKNHPQVFTPPMLKIQAAFPYDLVAVDLLQFPRSPKGNVALLMAIDHFSKFLIAVPIRDKTGKTVANAMKNRILPAMTRLPNRVLSDNGPEFRSVDFNKVLEEFNVTHIYSTAYKASSNGCIERCNQTILQLLRGNDIEEPWDIK